MPRSLLTVLVLAAALLAGCGGDDAPARRGPGGAHRRRRVPGDRRAQVRHDDGARRAGADRRSSA